MNTQLQPTFLRTLQRFGTAVDNDMDGTTNWGGCCLYAAEVGKVLAAYGMNPRGRVINGAERPLHIVEQEIYDGAYRLPTPDDWHDNAVNFGHVVLEFDFLGRTYRHDAELTRRAVDNTFPMSLTRSKRHASAWDLAPGHMSLRAMTDIVRPELHQSGWNPMCDHSQLRDVLAQHMPTILSVNNSL